MAQGGLRVQRALPVPQVRVHAEDRHGVGNDVYRVDDAAASRRRIEEVRVADEEEGLGGEDADEGEARGGGCQGHENERGAALATPPRPLADAEYQEGEERPQGGGGEQGGDGLGGDGDVPASVGQRAGRVHGFFVCGYLHWFLFIKL